MAPLLAVARLTRSEILREGMFWLVLCVSAVLILFSQYLPFFGDAESEIKLVMDMGFATMVLAGGALAVLYAGSGVAEDVEGRLAAMVLAKPVSRAQFVLGKYAGILQALALLAAVLTGVLLHAVRNEARHADDPSGGGSAPFWDRGTLQGSALALVEVSVVAAVGVAASSALPTVAAAAVTGLFFVGGHLSGSLPGRDAAWGAWLWGWLPDLSLLRIADALAMERVVPWSHVAAGTLYGALSAALFLAAACLILTRRDVA